MNLYETDQRIKELEATWLSPETYQTLMEERQETLRDLAASQAREQVLRGLTNELLRQIDIGTFVDQHGHSAKMLKATHDAMRHLSTPSDDTALRQWGAKLLREMAPYCQHEHREMRSAKMLLNKAKELEDGK